ncbi:MAG: TetR/AcrR family transcriptional regulator [Bullifex sp.]
MRKKNPVLEEEIISVSIRLLSEKGIPAFSLRALASELGISLGNLYTYYSSKDLILITILERKSNNLIREVSQLRADTTEEYIRMLASIFREQHSHETGPIMAEIGSSDEEAIRKMQEVLSSLDSVIAVSLEELGVEDTVFRASFIRRNIVSALRERLDMDKTVELITKAII